MTEVVTRLAKQYSQQFSGLRSFAICHRPKICPFDDVLGQIETGDRVFDIGSGSGFLLLAATKLRGASKCSGVEINSGLVAEATTQINSIAPDADIELSDSIDWPGEVFDVVTMIDVLHHFPPRCQDIFLEQAIRRVKPCGKFIFKDMARKPMIFALANRLHDLILARQWINYRDIADVEKICEANNCRKVFSKECRTYWYAHEMIVMQKNTE